MSLVETSVVRPDLAESQLSLKVSFLWTFAGTFLYAACNWGVLAIIAKLTGPAKLGEYALGVAIVTPIFMLANVNLRAVLATDITAKHRFTEYLDIRVIGTTLALLSIACIAWFQKWPVELSWAVLLVGCLQGVEAISDIHWGYLQRDERMKQISWSMIARGTLSFVALGLVLFITGRLIYALIAMVLARLGILVFVDLPQFWDLRSRNVISRGLGRKPTLQSKVALLWTALPLGMVLMFSSLAQSTPTYFIKRNLGIAEVGLFAAIVSLLSVGTTVINALGQAAMPRLAKFYVTGDLYRFRLLVLKMVAIGIATGLCGVGIAHFYGGPVLRLMYRPEFAQHANLLVAVMFSSVAIY
ncbi:MAG: oligosaccharide flippase family protein, partial [Terracidiphilus sp.]